MQMLGALGSMANPAAAMATKQNSAENLGKNDFLKLLIAQLRNQDPMKPMEDKEFISQMAQFNTLEQMQQLNENITAMSKRDQISQASALLGKQVEAATAGGSSVSGLVSEVRVVDGMALLIVGSQAVLLENVLRVKGAGNGR